MDAPQWQEGPPGEIAISKFEGLVDQINQDIIIKYSDKFGYNFEQLKYNPNLALHFLDHADFECRCLALTFAAWHWSDSEPLDVIDILTVAACNDPDGNVRGLAVSLLGGRAEGTGGSNVKRTLFNIIKNEHETNFVRCNAYISIIGPNHIDYSRLLNRENQYNFDSVKEIDWDALIASLEGS